MDKRLCSFLLPLLLVSCSSASFQESKKDRQAVESKAGKQTPKLQTKQLSPGSSDLGGDEDGEFSEDYEKDRVSQPVEVSGSFLACIPTGEDEIGCAIVDRGQKRDLRTAHLSWYGEDADGNGVALTGRRAGHASPFHSYIEAGADLARIEVVVVVEDGESFAYATQAPAREPGRISTDTPIHLGNGDFSASSCVDALQQVPTYGDRIRYDIRTDRKGPWLIRLGGICGVDNAGLLAIRVQSSQGTWQTINAGAESTMTFWVPDVGSQWTIEVVAQVAPGFDIEDFLFTDLSILGAGDIVLKAR